MTTYRQPEYEALIQEIRAEEQKNNGEESESGNKDLKVCNDMAFPRGMLTERELECITTVFRSFETGLRGATIQPSDLHPAMKMLGLNPTEQEVVDIPNNIAKKGLIYFPDFCQLILKRFRNSEEQEENFKQNMFKMLCGTDPFPTDFRAKKYKLEKHSISKREFSFIMRNLPACVSEDDIEQMFKFADKERIEKYKCSITDGDGELSYSEFQVMIDPPAPPQKARPHVSDLGMQPQVFSPDDPGPESAMASPLMGSSRVSSFLGSTTSLSTHQSRKHNLATSRASSVLGSNPNIQHL